MNRADRIIVAFMVTVIVACGAWAYNLFDVNDGQLRFEGTVTVSSDGMDPDAMVGIMAYGVPVEFVEDDAMVTFVGGETESRVVEGFGTLYVQATAQITEMEDGWIRACVITLSTNAPSLTASEWATVRVHEFGHCLGLKHEDHEDSIMAHSMDDENFSLMVTAHDREAVARRYFTR